MIQTTKKILTRHSHFVPFLFTLILFLVFPSNRGLADDGKKLEKSGQQEMQEKNRTPQAFGKQEEGSSKKTLKTILLITVGVLVVGAAAYFLLKKKDKAKEEPKPIFEYVTK